MEEKTSWIDIMEKYKNSVIQLICIRGVYNAFRPQHQPIDKKVSGSGFIVDIRNGLVLTNAHVVSNAISISGRMMDFGEYDLSLRLISICREKDIALCQLSSNDIEKIITTRDPDNINMIFGDNMLLRETEPVMTIGYPLGQKNLKFTNGVVSGFHANNIDDDEEEDFPGITEEETPSYIQITAPINPGNSGGPLLNRKGEVVGINSAGYMFSQNVGYAIGTRTVLSIYDSLLLPLIDKTIPIPYVVITPKYSFEYNRASDALLELSCDIPNSQGIYVKKVYPNSVFDTLTEGDIITKIVYNDIYHGNTEAFNLINRTRIMGSPITAILDKYGDVTSHHNRKITIKELFDMIPIGTEISLNICRQSNSNNMLCKSGGMYKITTIFKSITSNIRTVIYPLITPYNYLVVAGMSIGELSMNHISMDKSLEVYAKGQKRYKKVLVVNQIFPDTTSYHTRVFKEGSIIKSVNNTKVSTINDLIHVLSKSGDYIIFVGGDHEKFVVRKSDAIVEDLLTVKQFNILDYKSPL